MSFGVGALEDTLLNKLRFGCKLISKFVGKNAWNSINKSTHAHLLFIEISGISTWSFLPTWIYTCACTLDLLYIILSYSQPINNRAYAKLWIYELLCIRYSYVKCMPFFHWMKLAIFNLWEILRKQEKLIKIILMRKNIKFKIHENI